MNHAISGEILVEKVRFPPSEIFFVTLLPDTSQTHFIHPPDQTPSRQFQETFRTPFRHLSRTHTILYMLCRAFPPGRSQLLSSFGLSLSLQSKSWSKGWTLKWVSSPTWPPQTFGKSGWHCNRSPFGGRLATTLVDRYFHHYFLHFPFSPLQPFLIEGALGSKNLFCQSGSERLIN